MCVGVVKVGICTILAANLLLAEVYSRVDVDQITFLVLCFSINITVLERCDENNDLLRLIRELPSTVLP